MKKIEKPTVKKAKDGRANNGGARVGSGRKPFEPTAEERKQVEALSGYGLPQEHIAVLVRGGINVETLREHFSDELQSGKAKANSQIGQILFKKAMSGDTTAMIWWSKTQMRWTERHEITGADGGPIKTELTLDAAEAYKRLIGGVA